MSKVLLTSADYIKSQTELTDNTEDSKILPAIRLAQDIELTEALGSSLLGKLQELVGAGTISSPENSHYKVLLDDYVQPYLAQVVLSNLTLILGQKLGNIGVVTTSDENVENLSLSERGQLRDYYRHFADSYLYRMQRYLISEHSHFPELNKDDVLKIKSNLNSSASCGIYLGGVRCPNKKYPGYGKRWVASDILWSDKNL